MEGLVVVVGADHNPESIVVGFPDSSVVDDGIEVVRVGVTVSKPVSVDWLVESGAPSSPLESSPPSSALLSPLGGPVFESWPDESDDRPAWDGGTALAELEPR